MAPAMDAQLMLDAYDRLHAEDAAFRPIIETVADATVITLQGFESAFFCLACRAWLKYPQDEIECGEHRPNCMVARARAALK